MGGLPAHHAPADDTLGVLHGDTPFAALRSPANDWLGRRFEIAYAYSATGALAGVLGWLTYVSVSALVGFVLGAVVAFVLHKVFRFGTH